MGTTPADIVDLQAWSTAKARYSRTSRAKVTPWKDLTPRQRHMFYTSERLRGRI
jgi:hypothetical protein